MFYPQSDFTSFYKEWCCSFERSFYLTIELTPSKLTRTWLVCPNWLANQIPRISNLKLLQKPLLLHCLGFLSLLKEVHNDSSNKNGSSSPQCCAPYSQWIHNNRLNSILCMKATICPVEFPSLLLYTFSMASWNWV